MRDIKFRAWDKQTKRLYQVQTLQFYGTNNTVDACWTNGVDFDGESTLGEPELNNLHNLELMQYTGMKDVNGVEIYEGDIIREDIEKDGPPIIVSVVWEEGAFYGKERTHNPEYIAKEFLNGKVIGNIYENQELLED